MQSRHDEQALPDYYEFLDVDSNASTEQIQEALIDKEADILVSDLNAVEKKIQIKILLKAKVIFADAVSRREYDSQLEITKSAAAKFTVDELLNDDKKLLDFASTIIEQGLNANMRSLLHDYFGTSDSSVYQPVLNKLATTLKNMPDHDFLDSHIETLLIDKDTENYNTLFSKTEDADFYKRQLQNAILERPAMWEPKKNSRHSDFIDYKQEMMKLNRIFDIEEFRVAAFDKLSENKAFIIELASSSFRHPGLKQILESFPDKGKKITEVILSDEKLTRIYRNLGGMNLIPGLSESIYAKDKTYFQEQAKVADAARQAAIASEALDHQAAAEQRSINNAKVDVKTRFVYNQAIAVLSDYITDKSHELDSKPVKSALLAQAKNKLLKPVEETGLVRAKLYLSLLTSAVDSPLQQLIIVSAMQANNNSKKLKTAISTAIPSSEVSSLLQQKLSLNGGVPQHFSIELNNRFIEPLNRVANSAPNKFDTNDVSQVKQLFRVELKAMHDWENQFSAPSIKR